MLKETLFFLSNKRDGVKGSTRFSLLNPATLFGNLYFVKKKREKNKERKKVNQSISC